jgi:hypothetical protein
MKNYLLLLSILFLTFKSFSQIQKFPVFKGCEVSEQGDMERCFNSSVRDSVLGAFNVPEIVEKDGYKGTVNVLFFVNRDGGFSIIHVNSPYLEIEREVERVFKLLPIVTPAQYNGHAIDMSFALPLHFPNPRLAYGKEDAIEAPVATYGVRRIKRTSSRKKDLPVKKRKFLKHHSQLNIPFHHGSYVDIEKGFLKEDNSHTAVKPYRYNQVAKVIDLDTEKSRFLKRKSSWLGRKFWNENLAVIKGENYWFTTNLLLDLQIGNDNSDVKYTFNNSRILQVQGAIGKNLSFSASIYESQGRFASYLNEVFTAEQRKTFSSAGLVYGRGKAKQFKEDAYDYPVSEGYISYTPSKFFNVQLGQGKNFIGDGYRSLLFSDVASPYPYVKLTTNFWKIQYTNIWSWMTDISIDARLGNAHPRKYVSTHYLSINVNKRLNLGLFESVITDNSRTGTLDMDFVNPLIFYKSLEFARGEDAGSGVIGLSAKYKLSNKFMLYSQFVLDEFTLEEIKANTGYWGNKYGFQIGAKYFDALNVKNLFVQMEYNKITPYTFSHKTPIFNYGHYGESLAHTWGANFWESILIAQYKKNRLALSLKMIYGEKGFDTDDLNYGGDIYKPYDTRVQDYGNEIGQGATAKIFNSDLQVSYLINPSTDLKVFGGFVMRTFTPEVITDTNFGSTTLWLTLGLKVDLFNWYLDF